MQFNYSTNKAPSMIVLKNPYVQTFFFFFFFNNFISEIFRSNPGLPNVTEQGDNNCIIIIII